MMYKKQIKITNIRLKISIKKVKYKYNIVYSTQ